MNVKEGTSFFRAPEIPKNFLYAMQENFIFMLNI